MPSLFLQHTKSAGKKCFIKVFNSYNNNIQMKFQIAAPNDLKQGYQLEVEVNDNKRVTVEMPRDVTQGEMVECTSTQVLRVVDAC
jgi:Na+-transporting NADH:ubiquinone oxidoreductase subunit NqrF